MAYRILADVVVVVHLAFIMFVAVGSLVAWRWPRLVWLVWLHLPALAWAVAIITIGFECPLTPLEKYLSRRGGEDAYAGGFVDRYVEDVVYPDELTPWLRLAAAMAIVAGYVGLMRGRAGAARRPWRKSSLAGAYTRPGNVNDGDADRD